MSDDDQLRALRRAVARQHHPDAGGDPDEFVRVMDALERSAGASSGGDVVIVTSKRSRITRTISSTRKNLAHQVRRRVPWTRRERFGRI